MVEDGDLGLKIPANIPLSIVDKLLTVYVEVDLGSIPATLPPVTKFAVVYCCIYLLLIFMFIKLFVSMKEVIVRVIMEDVDLSLNIQSNLPFTKIKKLCMVMVEVDIGFIPSPLPPIIQAVLLDQ